MGYGWNVFFAEEKFSERLQLGQQNVRQKSLVIREDR